MPDASAFVRVITGVTPPCLPFLVFYLAVEHTHSFLRAHLRAGTDAILVLPLRQLRLQIVVAAAFCSTFPHYADGLPHRVTAVTRVRCAYLAGDIRCAFGRHHFAFGWTRTPAPRFALVWFAHVWFGLPAPRSTRRLPRPLLHCATFRRFRTARFTVDRRCRDSPTPSVHHLLCCGRPYVARSRLVSPHHPRLPFYAGSLRLPLVVHVNAVASCLRFTLPPHTRSPFLHQRFGLPRFAFCTGSTNCCALQRTHTIRQHTRSPSTVAILQVWFESHAPRWFRLSSCLAVLHCAARSFTSHHFVPWTFTVFGATLRCVPPFSVFVTRLTGLAHNALLPPVCLPLLFVHTLNDIYAASGVWFAICLALLA